MKGAMGLAIAAGLGIVGAVCNWLYLQQLAREQATVTFIAVATDVQLNIGDQFDDSDLVPVEIPENHVGNLTMRAPQWSAVDAVIGQRANRTFQGGEIILDDDLETPAIIDLASQLQEDEVARWVPIDSRTVVTEQINPGDLVSFEVPVPLGPTPADAPEPILAAGQRQIIGPFRVLALGSRRERPNIDAASNGRSRDQSNTMTIVVKIVNGQLEPVAATLFDAIQRAGNQGVTVQLHSSRLGS